MSSVTGSYIIGSHVVQNQRLILGNLATGQTTQYGGVADDGFYKKGIVKAYDVLTDGQYSGSVNITLNVKTDAHANACVFDRNTGLMWSRTVSASVGPTSTGALPWTTNGSGEGIFTYVAAANAAGLAGYSDWRVPNAIEIMSLIDYEAPNGLPDATAFPAWTTATQWTSTTQPNVTTNGMTYGPTQGSIAGGTVKTGALFVALVRG